MTQRIFDMENEIWCTIPGYDGAYEVSNYGRVRSLDRTINLGKRYERCYASQILKLSTCRGGYMQVGLKMGKNRKMELVHRLVAQAFIPNPKHKPQVNHIDGDKTNNRADNLEWCTDSENKRHAWLKGLMKVKHQSVDKRRVKCFKAIECVETGEIFVSVTAAAKRYNIAISCITNCAKGKTKNSAGHTWKYCRPVKREEIKFVEDMEE